MLLLDLLLRVSTVGLWEKPKMRHRAKFHQNRSNGCGDMAISLFQNGGRPPSWICWVCIGTTHDDYLVAVTPPEGGSFPLWVDVQKLCNMCVHCSKRVSFWGTSYSRPPIDPYLTSPPLLQNPGGATAWWFLSFFKIWLESM